MHPATAAAGHPLSLGQEALWFLQQLAPDSGSYNYSGAVNLHFPVDVKAMTTAVEQTLAAHGIVKSVFRFTGDEVRRHPVTTGPACEVHDLAGDDETALKFAEQFVLRPFHLGRRPPIRVALIRRHSNPDMLLMAVHHLVMDNIAHMLLLQEILDRYIALSTGTEHTGSGPADDFDDFVSAERAYLGSSRAAAARKYWRAELRDLDQLGHLPTDYPRPSTYRQVGAEIAVDLPPDVVARAAKAAAEQNTTPFAYLLSVYQLALYSFSGNTGFMLGYPVTMRSPSRFHDSLGYFINTLPFRAHIQPDDGFATLLRRTGQKVWRGLMYRDYPFALISRLADGRRDPSRAGLFSATFGLTVTDPQDSMAALRLPGRRAEYAGLAVSEFYLPQQQGQFDTTLLVLLHGTDSRAQLKYNTSLFTETTARELAGRFAGLLRAAASGTLPDRLGEVADGHRSPELRAE